MNSLRLWLEAAEFNGSSWRDRSGNGYHGTASGSPSTGLIAGRRTILFDGVDDVVVLGTTSDFPNTFNGTGISIYAVLQRVGSSNAQVPIANHNAAQVAGNGFSYYLTTSQLYVQLSDSSNPKIQGSPASVTTGNPHIYTTIFQDGRSPNDLTTRVDGSVVRSADASGYGTIQSWRPLVLGCGYNASAAYDYRFNGHVAEVIMYNVAHTDAERRAVEAYLSNKFSISI